MPKSCRRHVHPSPLKRGPWCTAEILPSYCLWTPKSMWRRRGYHQIHAARMQDYGSRRSRGFPQTSRRSNMQVSGTSHSWTLDSGLVAEFRRHPVAVYLKCRLAFSWYYLTKIQMLYSLLCSLWMCRRRTNRRPCCPPLSTPSTSPWTAWPDGAGQWDSWMAAQHLPRGIVRPSNGFNNSLKSGSRRFDQTPALAYAMQLSAVTRLAKNGR